jgi:hypothetical protein
MIPRASEARLDPTERCGRFDDVIERSEVVAAHRELVEASDAVRHLLVEEELTQTRIDEARERLACAYERVRAVDGELLRV